MVLKDSLGDRLQWGSREAREWSGAQAGAQGHLVTMEEKGTCEHKGRMKKDWVHLGPRSHIVGEGERESERHRSINPERLRTWAQPYQTGVKRRPQGRTGVPVCGVWAQGERAGRTIREALDC